MPTPPPDRSPLSVTHDVTRGQWLTERLGSWATVGGVAGSGFEAYARVFHPATARRLRTGSPWPPATEADFAELPQDETLTWSRAAALTGRTAHPLMQWDSLVDTSHGQAELDGGWIVNAPEHGWLDPGILAALEPALADATTTPDALTLGVWEGWGALRPGSGVALTAFRSDRPYTADELAEIQNRLRAEELAAVSPEVVDAIEQGRMLRLPGRAYVLFTSSLAALAAPSWQTHAGIGWRGAHGPMPQLIWPDDHAWCVATEIDWDSTIVAGARNLIDAVLALDDLEVAEVTATDDLSWNGDLLNPKPE